MIRLMIMMNFGLLQVPAGSLQALLLRHLKVLGYFFTAKSSNVRITDLVHQALSFLNSCNFTVVATVCDQGPSNLAVYRQLG
ncbi:hypothetical protein JTE90_002580 [Oedothorax gibbosus]|uniref:Transposable element P transposase-like RNase H domain-containing protein n=1 Tax=Oedothorax gibbosus TaxID=931172 RepID=A0AAV6TTN9_9ARAC|nr:hypothetical protein JTE90_002580 [Oedothorax gibbosus]